MTKVVLPNVTLAAIVRDEMINPAGGIVDFLHCTLPFVDEAVIVDTGSVDGTRDILEDAKRTYPHLRVYHHEFRGFAGSRNQSLTQVRTPYVLVLDADERLFQKDFEELRKLSRIIPDADSFSLPLNNIDELGTYNTTFFCIHNPRFFRIGNCIVYKSDAMEYLSGEFKHNINTTVKVKHFLPSFESVQRKREAYHNLGAFSIDNEGFLDSKQLNPQRMNYHFGLPDYQIMVPVVRGERE